MAKACHLFCGNRPGVGTLGGADIIDAKLFAPFSAPGETAAAFLGFSLTTVPSGRTTSPKRNARNVHGELVAHLGVFVVLYC
jgi:hypothetical protein